MRAESADTPTWICVRPDDSWNVSYDAEILPYRCPKFDDLWKALAKSKTVQASGVARVRQAAEQAESLLPISQSEPPVSSSPSAASASSQAIGLSAPPPGTGLPALRASSTEARPRVRGEVVDDVDDDDDDLPEVGQIFVSRAPPQPPPQPPAAAMARTPPRVPAQPASAVDSPARTGPRSVAERPSLPDASTSPTRTLSSAPRATADQARTRAC